jgi:hypothetical protein
VRSPKQIFLGLLLYFASFAFLWPWVQHVVKLDSLVVVFTLLTSFIAIFAHIQKKQFASYLLVFVFVYLSYLQLNTVNIANVYSFSNAERDLQITRMNEYPSQFAKLGYIWETKKETLIFRVIEDNFFYVVDFNTYFGNYIFLLGLPLFLIGLYAYVSMSKISINIILFTSIVLLSIIGINGKYGPFIIFPSIIMFIYIGTNSLVDYISYYE